VHNISAQEYAYGSGQAAFLAYIRNKKNYETIINSSGAGLSISYKRASK
jgi:hypothetical protein